MEECQGCIQKEKEMEEAAKVLSRITEVAEKVRKYDKKLTDALKESSAMIKTLIGDIRRGENAIQSVGPRAGELRKENQMLRQKLAAAMTVMGQAIRERKM